MVAILFTLIIFPCHCAVYMYKIMVLQKPLCQFPPNFTLILLLKCDWLFVQMIMLYWLSGPNNILLPNLRTAQMMIFQLVAMIGLGKCCITSAYLQWLCSSGERAMAHGPPVTALRNFTKGNNYQNLSFKVPVWPWKQDNSCQNLVTSFPNPTDVSVLVWSNSIYWFMR